MHHEFQLGSTSTIKFKYFQDGRHFSKTTPEKTLIYFNRYAHIDPAAKKQQHFYYLGNDRVATKNMNGQQRTYLADHLGSNRMMVDEAGQLVRYTDHKPFGGAVLEKERQEGDPYGFATSFEDDELGLSHLQARFYSKDLGRFISPDPLFLEKPEICVKSPIECGLYGYARNNPLKYVDPTGLYGVFAGYNAGIGMGLNGRISVPGSVADNMGLGFYVGIEPGTQGRAEIGSYSYNESTRIDGAKAGTGVEVGVYIQDSKDILQVNRT